jgi:hypothetical protein
MNPDPLQVLISLRKCYGKLQEIFTGNSMDKFLILTMTNYLRSEFRYECFLNSWPDMSKSISIEDGVIGEAKVVIDENSELIRLIEKGFSIEEDIASVIEG